MMRGRLVTMLLLLLSLGRGTVCDGSTVPGDAAIVRQLLELEQWTALDIWRAREGESADRLLVAEVDVALARRGLYMGVDNEREAIGRYFRLVENRLKLGEASGLSELKLDGWRLEAAEDYFRLMIVSRGLEAPMGHGLWVETRRDAAGETANELKRMTDGKGGGLVVFSGMATLLEAQWARAVEGKVMCDPAVMEMVLEKLGDATDVMSPALQWRVNLYRGCALAEMGWFDEAEALIRAVATAEGATEEAKYFARLAGTRNREVRGFRDGGAKGAAEAVMIALESIAPRYMNKETGEIEQPMMMEDIAGRWLRARWRIHSWPQRGEWPALAVDFERAMHWAGGDRVELWIRERAAVLIQEEEDVAEVEMLLPLPTSAILGFTEGYLARGEVDRGRTLLQMSIERGFIEDGSLQAAHILAARAAALAGDSSDAIEHWLSAIGKDPSLDEVAWYARQVERHLGDALIAEPEEGWSERLADILRTVEARGRATEEAATILRVALARSLMHDARDGEAVAILRRAPGGSVGDPEIAGWMVVAMARWLDSVRGEVGTFEGRCLEILNILDANAQAIEAWQVDAPKAHAYGGDFLKAEALLGLGRYEEAEGILNEPGRGDGERGLLLQVELMRRMGRLADAEALMRESLEMSGADAERLVVEILDGLIAEIDGVLNRGEHEAAVSLARERGLPWETVIDAWWQRVGGAEPMPMGLQNRLAELEIRANAFERALARFEAIEARVGERRETILGRARCQFGLGGEDRLTEAMGLYRQLGRSVTREGEPDIWWEAQLRQLEILDRVERHIEQIGPRIRRLRALDQGMGGARFRDGFARLEAKHG